MIIQYKGKHVSKTRTNALTIYLCMTKKSVSLFSLKTRTPPQRKLNPTPDIISFSQLPPPLLLQLAIVIAFIFSFPSLMSTSLELIYLAFLGLIVKLKSLFCWVYFESRVWE